MKLPLSPETFILHYYIHKYNHLYLNFYGGCEDFHRKSNPYASDRVRPGGTPVDIYAYKYSLPTVLAYCAWSKITDIDGKILAENLPQASCLRFLFSSWKLELLYFFLWCGQELCPTVSTAPQLHQAVFP
jgi:hypothetical protein